MKKIFVCIFFCCSLKFDVCLAQAGEWTWMKGDNTQNNLPVYGNQGIADSTVNPPSVYEPVEWTDHQGNFWLFGGSDGSNTYADLWMFNTASNDWTWMKGPGTGNALAIYGTQGVASPTNNPGARAWGAISWVDTAGNLWMYGGQGYGSAYLDFLGELWMYNISTNEWTWMGGLNQLPSHGTLGVPSASNYPGARVETNAAWVDADNNLWFFGSISDLGMMNDLWKYEMSSGNWVWMKGANTAGQSGSYGTLGVESATNVPGCRATFTKWTDTAGNFWMFGGCNYSTYVYNDLWRYSVATGNWTWMGGNDFANGSGTSGAKCEDSSSFISNTRYENRACWRDACGNFWFLGGRDQFSYDYNDLWVYSIGLNKWAWVAGTLSQNATGIYGTKGVPDPANYPGARDGNVGWLANDGSLWMFGGWNFTYNYFNDLWRFTPDSACLAWLKCSGSNSTSIPNSFAASDTDICEKFCIDFYDSSLNNPTSWQWQFAGGNPSSSTLQNPANICYNTPGVYDVTLITTNAGGSDTLTLSNYITVYTNPFAPVISQTGNMLTSTPAASYQWQLNSVDIPAATNQSYTITQSGLYTVIIGDDNGCSAQASVDASYVGIAGADGNFLVNIFPNPSSGSFMIELSNGLMAGDVSIDVVNTLGQKVFSSTEKIYSSSFKKEINLCRDATSCVSTGVYFIEIKTKSEGACPDFFGVRKKIIVAK